MTKILKPSEIRRAQRTNKILSLAKRNASKFGTQLELYMYIAGVVGCSHITVYKTLKDAELWQ